MPGEAKRRKDLGIEKVEIKVGADMKDNMLSNIYVSSDRISNWFVITVMLSKALDLALAQHAKQMVEASERRIVAPSGGDIATISGGKAGGA